MKLLNYYNKKLRTNYDGKRVFNKPTKRPLAGSHKCSNKKGLIAYYIQMRKGTDGYGFTELEELISSCNLNEEFIRECTCFVSDIKNYHDLLPLVPNYLEW